MVFSAIAVSCFFTKSICCFTFERLVSSSLFLLCEEFVVLTASPWFVVMSKPRGEELAYQQLANQEFDVYLPMCARAVRRRNCHLTVISPMFPRYLFVRPSHEEQGIGSIRSTAGVQQLVRFGTEFAMASESLVADIKAMEACLCGGSDSLPFKAGDEVEITEGPFVGVTAKVFACAESRVLLLFQLLGSIRKLGFSPDQCRRI